MKRYTILLAAIAITACIIFVTINIINQDTIQVIDYSSDYTSMPKGFDSLPEYNEETDSEILLLTSLQGIVAQECAEIYIGKTSDKWIKYVSKEYGLTLEKKNDLKELITNYKDRINGYVKAEWKTNNTYNKQINQASTLSGIESLLIAAVKDNDKGKEMTDIIESLGIESSEDFIKNNMSYSDKYKLSSIYDSEDTETFYVVYYAYINEYKTASFCTINYTYQGEIQNYLIKDEFEKFVDIKDIRIDKNKEEENILSMIPEGCLSYEIDNVIICIEDNKIIVSYNIRYYTNENSMEGVVLKIDYESLK